MMFDSLPKYSIFFGLQVAALPASQSATGRMKRSVSLRSASSR